MTKTGRRKTGISPDFQQGAQKLNRSTKRKEAIRTAMASAYYSQGKGYCINYFDRQLKSGPIKKFTKEEIEQYELEANTDNNQ